MVNPFIEALSAELLKREYITTRNPILPGGRGLLYAKSPLLTTFGPIKFTNYYLFLDWENDLFCRLEELIANQKSFSAKVNKEFSVAHGWRMKLPNLVVAAVSENPFPIEAINYVQTKYQIPWMGGEIGQLMLFDLINHKQYCHYKKAYKQTGSIPLGYAVDELFGIYNGIYADASLLMHGEK